MSAFYKERFNSFLKSENSQKLSVKRSMERLVHDFIHSEFGNSQNRPDLLDRPEFLDAVITVLHSHRHKKKDDYIVKRDFSIIRQVLYSFSTAAKRTFLSNENYALIFSHFHAMKQQSFLEEKSRPKPEKFREELTVELTNLYEAARKTLNTY